MQTINRANLLQQLLAVQPGLAEREIIEQSSCVAFVKGRAYTYNDEVSCSAEVPVKLSGAVPAKTLLSILGKMPDEELEVEEDDAEVVFRGKGRRFKLRKEAKIALPVDKLEVPDAWSKLPKNFTEAIDMVRHSASSDKSRFKLTCVHLSPVHVEACDNFQLSRFRLKTGLKQSVLVKKSSIEHIIGMGMVEMSETDTWLHFRNPAGVVLSCRRYVEKYHDVDGVLKEKGKPIVLPKRLGDAADRASVFSSEAANDNQVRVRLQEGLLRIRGVGEVGWYTETRKVTYDGPELEFLISPSLLGQIADKFREAFVDSNQLRVEGPEWVFVTCLGKPTDKVSKSEAEEK
mgnify:CR=1 FL=1